MVRILVAGLLAVAGGVAAQDREDGRQVASGARRLPPAGSPIVPTGLDDTLQLPALVVPATPAPDVSDTAAETPAAAPSVSLAERLASIEMSRRQSVAIDIELVGVAGETEASAVEALWGAGDFETALEELRALEREGQVVGVGIDWGAGGGGRKDWSMDTRIGGTRTEAQELCLDFDAPSGNLFSVVRWGSTTGTSAWTVNLSTDNGSTWTETYSFPSSAGIVAVAAVAVDDFVYIAYVAGNVPDEGRLRRVSATTGLVDGGFGYHVVVDGGTANVEEVALAANPDDFDNRIYYLALMDDDTIRYLYDAADDGQTFTDGAFPATAGAEYGLDATFIHNSDGQCVPYVAISYSGNDGAIHVWRRTEGAWFESVVEGGAGPFRPTSIAAYGTTVLCAYEFPYPTGTGVRYSVSYTCGETWSSGDLAIPDGTRYFGFFEPEVAARGGYGTGIAYQGESGDFDPVFYRFRYGYHPGSWTFPVAFNQHDAYTGSDTDVMIVPPFEFGFWRMVGMYLSLDPDFRTPYVDISIDFDFFHEPPIFEDNFELGNLGAWSAVVP